jgi:hypothetical protein
MSELDEDLGLRDAAHVVAARREIDPVLANLVAQPFDAANVQAMTRWLVEVYPSAAVAFTRLQNEGRRGPFCSLPPGTGEVAPVAGGDHPSRVPLTVVSYR